MIGISQSYLSLLKNNKRVASQEVYDRIINAKTIIQLQEQDEIHFQNDNSDDEILDILINS